MFYFFCNLCGHFKLKHLGERENFQIFSVIVLRKLCPEETETVFPQVHLGKQVSSHGEGDRPGVLPSAATAAALPLRLRKQAWHSGGLPTSPPELRGAVPALLIHLLLSDSS